MRLIAVELEDVSGDGIGPAVVNLEGLTVAIGRNGVGKTLVLEGVEAVLSYRPHLERGGVLGDPPIPFGSVVVTATTADWPWLRQELATALADNLEESSELGDPARVLGLDADPGDEESAVHSTLGGFMDRLRHTFIAGFEVPHRSQAAEAFHPLFADDSAVQLSMGIFPGANVWWSPPLEVRDLVVSAAAALRPHVKDGAVAAVVLDRLLRPPGHVGLLLIGALPDDRDPDPVLTRLPLPVRLVDRVEDPAAVVSEVLRRSPGGGQWLVRDDDTGFAPNPRVALVLDDIGSRANDLAPEFISHIGRIVVRAPEPATLGPEPTRPVIAVESDDGRALEFDLLGAGTRRWVAIAVVEACRQRSADPTDRQPVYLIDEPEMHLHPLAQAKVSEWIDERVDEGCSVVVATHSPVFMASRHPTARLLALTRVDGQLHVSDVSAGALEALTDDTGLAIGVDPAAAFQLVRGFLFVEGLHDYLVIKQFFGAELAAACIEVIPLHGHRKAPAVVDSQLLRWAGKPLVVLFDEVAYEASDAANSGTDVDMKATSSEEKAALRLAAALRADPAGLPCRVVPFPLPDVIAAIPMSAIERAYPHSPSLEWPVITESWRARLQQDPNPPGGFKFFARDRLKIKDGADEFVRRSLAATSEVDRPAPELTRAVNEAIAFLTSGMLGN